jgi:hypothetical protein
MIIDDNQGFFQTEKSCEAFIKPYENCQCQI